VTFNNPSSYFRENTTGVNFNATTCAGTVVPAQAGFDNSSATNTAALFPYNGCIIAPNDTLGDFEWNQPFSVMVQVDALNYARTTGATVVLASKGDISVSHSRYWELTMNMNSQHTVQFCFTVQGGGSTSYTSNPIFNTSVCTQLGPGWDYPNGYNYNIIAMWDGSGGPGRNASPATSGIFLSVNGSSNVATATTNSAYAAGALVVTGSGGTGYPNSFPLTLSSIPNATCKYLATATASGGVVNSPTGAAPASSENNGCSSNPTVIAAPYYVVVNTSPTATSTFTSTGGGTGCLISGSVTTAGVVSYTSDTNCSSAPTLNITGSGTYTVTANTGTGATFTSAMFGATLSTSTTAPLYIGGALSNGSSIGISSANSGQPGILIDEFAIFPYVLSQTQIQSLFYLTKFYQRVLKPLPSSPLHLIYSNDGCADEDNQHALQAVIALQRLGYIRLDGVEDVAGDGTSEAFYRQVLDQAGLAHISLSVPSSFVAISNSCTAANANTYNSATPQVASAYMSSKTMYRTILAANPTTPVYIMTGGGLRGIADLLTSSADSISSLTGEQLWAQNIANGAYVNGQGLGPSTTLTGANNINEDYTAAQTVMAAANNCPGGPCMPWYWYGYIPQSAGPGILYTRNSKDPFYLFAVTYGSDTRQAYDSLPVASFASYQFAGGVSIAMSGSGTGYANVTAFSNNGTGGPNCYVYGQMLSVSGVPSSIQNQTSNLGYGCTSVPTLSFISPTGTGETLTASLLDSGCQTITITSATSGTSSSSSCTGQYFRPLSFTGAPGNANILGWFLNSLIDPPPNGAPRYQ
jgi:hypothetical protein